MPKEAIDLQNKSALLRCLRCRMMRVAHNHPLRELILVLHEVLHVCLLVSGAENANNVRLETLKKKLPRLQERDQSRGRFGGGGGGRGDRSGGG
ncbi:hypothetical protein Godav_007504, partial [Gossypium davidsonii]|nr:hypothetical protein [Gossypium davidsonii]